MKMGREFERDNLLVLAKKKVPTAGEATLSPRRHHAYSHIVAIA